VTQVLREGERVTGLAYVPSGESRERTVRCPVVVDASGQASFFSHQRVAGPRVIDHFSRQIAFFSHFENVRRDPGAFGNNTTIFYAEVDHWAWIIPISPTVDSVGIVIPQETFRKHAHSIEEALAWGIAQINPELANRLAEARQAEPVRACRDYSYRIDPFVGEGWLCVGDAHRFLDPIFSFGVSFAMTEAVEAAKLIPAAIESRSTVDAFRHYAEWSDVGQGVAYDLIRYFWRFPVFFRYRAQQPNTRRELIRLLGGDCFAPDDMRTPRKFREALLQTDSPVQLAG
jgi:flavin-dependent dehydrogenase